MSEEVLKALMQLFAILAKQDGGVELKEREFVKLFLEQQLMPEIAEEYLALFDQFAEIDKAKTEKSEEEAEPKLTSVKDSVKTLNICKKISKTLSQKQKVVVLVRLYELLNSDKKYTMQRMAIIDAAAEVFKIPKEEYSAIDMFVRSNNPEELNDSSILVINNDSSFNANNSKHIIAEDLTGCIFIIKVNSVDLYFFKHTGDNELQLNNKLISNDNIHILANGSTIRPAKGKPIYSSDIVSRYLKDSIAVTLSFNVKNLGYTFPTGDIGLRNINLFEEQGKLVGIMGSSGAGKTTLLSVLSGIINPTEGEIIINGRNLVTEKDELKGVIGYIPQDDLLIEELTVFDNLFYSAKLSIKNKSDQEITELVNKTLQNLELNGVRNLRVGSPLNKTISGGQRKRVNIALELLREPSILFVDEPTSGLSSRDSENVMDLLRELVLKGKLIFVVIHQPSSDIYKMFDKMIILDTGGYLVYYGNSVEAVTYFKKLDFQINSSVGECTVCGNVNPEIIFNIIDAKVVDDFGRFTPNRKVTAQKWNSFYQNNFNQKPPVDKIEELPAILNIPSWFKQLKIFTVRDFLSKIGNLQYIILNLLEAPLLAVILAVIIKYFADPSTTIYNFRENENIPQYFFMSVVVALFLGLIISAEEIYKDRKILIRERFLNLSRSSYLLSKIAILFAISAIQAVLYMLLGNMILELKGMNFEFFIAFFTIQAFANMLGLNISASFNSAVTIYILIPLLMIPQMILGGAMFSFDKLNRNIVDIEKVPVIAEFMASRWAYEALMVHQYKNNEFEKYFFDLDKKESMADFKQVYFVPELVKAVDSCEANYKDASNNSQKAKTLESNLALLKNEISQEIKNVPSIKFVDITKLTVSKFNPLVAFFTKEYLDNLKTYYNDKFLEVNQEKEKIINYLIAKQSDLYQRKKDAYYNETVSEIVRKVYEKNKIIRYDNRLIQRINPIYLEPDHSSIWSFRSHFYAPMKYFMNHSFDTFWFNMIIIWIMTISLYVTLYYESFKKGMEVLGKVNWRKIYLNIKKVSQIINKNKK